MDTQRSIDCQPLIGLRVGQVIAALAIPITECTVFAEPPGVGRGLHWSGPDQTWLSIWVSRGAGMFRLDCDWPVSDFLGLRAVGIVIHQPGQVWEWWAGGSRFSQESQR